MAKGKTIPLNKLSKKARKAYFSGRRSEWGEVKPVTRVIPDKRAKLLEARLRDDRD